MVSLEDFTLAEMTRCTAALRRLGVGADSPVARAQRVTDYLFDSFGDARGRHIALTRIFVTHPYGTLSDAARACADHRLAGQPATPETPCLTLMGSTGLESSWTGLHPGSRYLAIPLISEDFVQQFPMFSQLLSQLGIRIAHRPTGATNLLLDQDDHRFNVFYVRDALGSPSVPVQAFVETYGVRTVIGFGGLLPCGAFFAAILFTRVSLPPSAPPLFKPLARSIRLALLPTPEEDPSEEWQPIYTQCVEELLDVHEEVVLDQAHRITAHLHRLEQQREHLRTLALRLEMAQEAERRRISQDLHDDILTQLGGLLVYLASAERSGTDLVTHLVTAHTELKRITDDLRRFTRPLHPSWVERLGLSAAVIRYLEDFELRTGLSVTLTLSPDFMDPHDGGLATCLFRVLQEGLQNVYKHAAGADATVALLQTEDGYQLDIRDEGPGCDAAVVGQRGGLGLHTMAERIEGRRGIFTWTSAPGRGTTVSCTVPYRTGARTA